MSFVEKFVGMAQAHSCVNLAVRSILVNAVKEQTDRLQWRIVTALRGTRANKRQPAPTEIDAALQRILDTRLDITRLVPPSGSGVYAIYLRTPGLLVPFPDGENGRIYIGLSTNLASREFEQHFSSENTGFSTVRRSLGAILKHQLRLRAVPRGPGSSESNSQNYCFQKDGEARLTSRMRVNLEVGVFATPKFEAIENALIKRLVPLLNLKQMQKSAPLRNNYESSRRS